MRRFSKISGMTLVTCDHTYEVRYPGEGVCGAEFRTCSDKSVVQKQLDHAGWSNEDALVKGHKQSLDLCPHHTEIRRKRMTYPNGGITGTHGGGGSRFG